jgi:hypothetical protein
MTALSLDRTPLRTHCRPVPPLNHLVVAEHLGLPEHRIHKSRLAVVDVSNDGDVTDVLTDTLAARGAGGRGRCE